MSGAGRIRWLQYRVFDAPFYVENQVTQRYREFSAHAVARIHEVVDTLQSVAESASATSANS